MIFNSPTGIAGSAIVLLMMGTGTLYFLRPNVQLEDPPALHLANTLPVPAVGFELPLKKNLAFSTGEKLLFNIIFKGITVGHATIEITDGPLVNGRPTLKYVSKAESTHFFDFFFKVRDENVSTVDKASLFSLSFDQTLNEGHYHAIRRYDFDYIHKNFIVVEKKKDKVKKNVGSLNGPVYDILSALYFVRTLDLSAGRDLSLSIYRDNGGKKLPIKIGEALKIQKTPAGKIACWRVEPVIQGDSIFKSNEGGLVVWMTNDDKKLPVLMEAHATVGIIRVKLATWEK